MKDSLEVFSESLASLLPTVGSETFPRQLVALLKRLVSFDNALLLVYQQKLKPLVVYNDLPTLDREVNVSRFIKGVYLLDPCYRAITDNQANGFYRLRDIAPKGFASSEYYRNYYRYTGLTDEFGYILAINETTSINISLGRTQAPQSINSREIRILESVATTITELYRQHWNQQSNNSESSTLHNQLESALDNFGCSMLTDRETQVVQLFLHGHSTRSIAERLGISPETVKLHRKNSYSKLDVRSQAELFYLFIDSLSSLDNYTGGDPLVGYLTHST